MKSFILSCVCLFLSSAHIGAASTNDSDSSQQTGTLSKLRIDQHNRKLMTKRQDRKGPLVSGSVSPPLSPLPQAKASSKVKGTKGPKASKAPKASKKAKGTKAPKASKAPSSKKTKGSTSAEQFTTRRNLQQSSKGLVVPSRKTKGTKGPKATKAPKGGSKKTKGTKAPKSETVSGSGGGQQRRALTLRVARA
ncbi:hypothetical protein MPSEU_000123000 [Mayamaea pseudoterrestris]|nr:hypothetical protein MPSEU_000123000 [Mayamaea pseudoterrestris]